MKIKEYINHHKIDKSHTSFYNNTFKYVTTDIKKANEHLFTYFKRIKDENKERINKYINRLIELLSELESSYEESYNRNKNMVLVIIHFVCFLKLRDNKTIICGCEYNGAFCFYNMERDEYRITKNNHTNIIYDLLLIDDNTFLSC